MKILALTTDPINNLQGYALVFFRMFNYLQDQYPVLEIKLFSNKGLSRKVVNNKNFQAINIKKENSLIIKSYLLSKYLLLSVLKNSNRKTTIVTNCEIPELLVGAILKKIFRYQNVFCVIQDMRSRKKTLFIKIITQLRFILIYQIGNGLFVNSFTAKQFNSKLNKYYIGNPIFN